MPVVYPELNPSSAIGIIADIRRLKSRRYNHEISRIRFLVIYEALREALNETEEYKTLRRFIIRRSYGKCEKCHTKLGNQMCHKIGVAFRPDLALRKDNVYWGCDSCHQLDHPDLRLTPRTSL